MPRSPHPAQPLYADRHTGQVFEHAPAMVDAYVARFAERAGVVLAPLDEAGCTEFRKGTARVHIQALSDHGVLLLVAPVLSLPPLDERAGPDAVARRAALYRRLLEASFLSTSDAAFAIDAPKDEVVVRALRRLSGLDYEEFEDLLETVGEVADSWDGALARDLERP